MNGRRRLSLAALCFALPALAAAQAGPAATAAAPAAAPAPAPAPTAAPAPAAASAISITPYGFVLLDYHQNFGAFSFTDYPGMATSEDGKSNLLSARQSRIGLNVAGLDGGYTGAKVGGRIEFDFMGPGATSWNSAPMRLRYAFATAGWDFQEAGKLTLLFGQTDGLVAPLHPELMAHIALPMFLYGGNYFRRSPQLRATYDLAFPMVALRAEVAALSAADASGVSLSAGNASGLPDAEARLQGTVTPRRDVAATLGVAYHVNKRHYEATAGKAATASAPSIQGSKDSDVTASTFGIDVNVDATKYFNVRGEYFQGAATDDIYFGLASSSVAVVNPDADPVTADKRLTGVKSSGYWAQATIKPCAQAWLLAGFGHTEVDDSTLAPAEALSADRLANDMVNVGILSSVSKNWKLSLEYTTARTKVRNGASGSKEISASAVAFASRFSF